MTRVICRMRELMGQTQRAAHPGLFIETEGSEALSEQPHPGRAPVRLHSWNSCTLSEPAPSPWLRRLPLFSGVPGTAGQAPRAEELPGAPVALLCQEGAEHSMGLRGSCPPRRRGC